MCILALPEDLFGLPSSLREGQQLAPLLCERLVDAELAAEAERRAEHLAVEAEAQKVLSARFLDEQFDEKRWGG